MIHIAIGNECEIKSLSFFLTLVAMPPKASKPLPSTGPPAPTLEGDWEKHLPEAAV